MIATRQHTKIYSRLLSLGHETLNLDSFGVCASFTGGGPAAGVSRWIVCEAWTTLRDILRYISHSSRAALENYYTIFFLRLISSGLHQVYSQDSTTLTVCTMRLYFALALLPALVFGNECYEGGQEANVDYAFQSLAKACRLLGRTYSMKNPELHPCGEVQY